MYGIGRVLGRQLWSDMSTYIDYSVCLYRPPRVEHILLFCSTYIFFQSTHRSWQVDLAPRNYNNLSSLEKLEERHFDYQGYI